MLPCSLKLKLQPAVLSPQRPVTSLPVYFAFFKFFSFMHLRTLPSSVSCKSFACHSYENCRGVYQQFPIWNAPRPSRGARPFRNPSIRHFRLCELCFVSRLCVNPGLSSFATVHGSLSTFAYPLSFQIIADSFALCKIISPFFSCNSGLFAQNTRGWGRVHYKNEEKDGALPTGSGQVPVAATGGQPRKRRMPGATGR